MTLPTDAASKDWDLTESSKSLKPYIICSQPRTGSHHMAELLRNTGQAGVPLEYFNQKHWKAWQVRTGLSNPRLIFRAICQSRTSSNGVFGVKMHWEHFQKMCSYRLEKEFINAKLIYLTREDLLGQAISFVIAGQTGSWISEIPAQAAPRYSFAAINSAMQRIVRERASWELFFAMARVTPIRISYEYLVGNKRECMEAVAQHININWHYNESREPVVKPQRTGITELWKERFWSNIKMMSEDGDCWFNQFSRDKNNPFPS